ncbi:type III-B CRISPR module-associated protein Cmr5 [Laceyella tengchongensis]|jgi:CRISPR-associated protein Cmr5|uniref:type III-B CRISPR module-associated protein Cmr5 n=1 Tax=Laceyella tengchongensis TaxID=574699 RepID=UPI0012B754FA|nr:type III-B CRISPR module-associated protein Cmr5 [Laceyella tengchongensis]
MEQTLDQKRATDSLEKVKRVKENCDSDAADDYAGYVVRLAGAIRINGLGQALAQLLAAAKQDQNDPHLLVYQDLQQWLCRNDSQAPYPNEPDLLEALVKRDRDTYQWALAEAMAWLEWHKKLAVAYLKKPEEGQG